MSNSSSTFFTPVMIACDGIDDFLLKIRSNFFLMPLAGLILKVVIKEDPICMPAIFYCPFQQVADVFSANSGNLSDHFQSTQSPHYYGLRSCCKAIVRHFGLKKAQKTYRGYCKQLSEQIISKSQCRVAVYKLKVKNLVFLVGSWHQNRAFPKKEGEIYFCAILRRSGLTSSIFI